MSSGTNERFVQEAHERRDPPEDLYQAVVETRRRGERRLELAPREKLSEFEVLHRLVVAWKPARHALQPLAFERPDVPAEARRFDERTQPPRIARDVLAHGVQLRGRRGIHAAADPD